MKSPPKATAGPLLEAAALPLTSRPAGPLPAIVVLPPPEPKKASKGFFGTVKAFFGSVFR